MLEEGGRKLAKSLQGAAGIGFYRGSTAQLISGPDSN